jgi:threonine/homoserine/homoserine lactone efflux protein
MSRLQIALSVYALLAVVAWFTLSDQRFRYLTIAFLAFFAIRVWTTSQRQKLEERDKQDEKSDPEE